MDFTWKITDEQLIVKYDDGMLEFIYLSELRGWCKKEQRLTTQRLVLQEGIPIDSDTIPITFDDYVRTLDKTEIETFLFDRRQGDDI